jgi:quercetin dioxygenase-like cupin family protein
MSYSINLKPVAAVLLLAAGAAIGSADPKPLAPVEAPRGERLAIIELDKEYQDIPAMKGYTFYQSLITVPPGTGRAWHSHAGRPEIVRILSGTLTDQRGDGKPKTYGPGSTITNADGIRHMWANFGKEPVVFLATSVSTKRPQPQ